MLPSPPERWVLDASVIINLLSMPDPARVVGSLGVPCITPVIAAHEVRRIEHPARKNGEPFEEVRQLIQVVDLSDAEWEVFGELTGAPSPDDLDDGEAAVLAVTAVRGGACLLDERKCIRIARSRVPPITSRSTIDLLRWCASSGFSKDEVADCIAGALQYSRMRVPPEHDEWVRDIIGADRAARFPSLRQVRPANSRLTGLSSG